MLRCATMSGWNDEVLYISRRIIGAWFIFDTNLSEIHDTISRVSDASISGVWLGDLVSMKLLDYCYHPVFDVLKQ